MVSHLLFWGGLLLALVQLILPIFFELIDLQLRAIHITLGVSLALLNFPFRKTKEEEGKAKKLHLFDLVCILTILAANLNAFLKVLDIYANPGGATLLDLILGGALTLIILDSARRSVGWAIPVMVVLLLAYIFLGDYFPGMWRLRGINLSYVINSIYFSPLGIYGSVTGMSATFIAMFIIFGSLLSATGGGKTFIDLAFALTGRYSGGPAKAAVISSALFGSISGSSVANVMVTGSYTIPMMKKLGYKPEFAGAVEAIASSGGGITPPIMSITAFMMAEFLNISYLRIIAYALLPCVLYYLGVFFGVHFQTKRYGLGAVPKEEIPKWKEILTFERLAGLLIPTIILLTMIGLGQPLIRAGFYAAVSSLLVFLIQGVLTRSLKESLKHIIQALAEGGLDVARIAPILISVGILVNLIGITGLAPKISGLILEVGGKNFLISLLIATIVPFLLGTSLPVVPTYVLSISILAPPLLRLGVDEVAAHLFFIYWAILGGVTPPTCTAAVAAAGIAKANWIKTGLNAVKLGAVAFILPYFFMLNPSLVGRADAWSILSHGVSAAIGAVGIAYALFGMPPSKTALLFRVGMFIGSVLMLFPGYTQSGIGFGLALISFVVDRLILRKRETLA
ncbi:MAG: TRAP transporter fused permease subunit [Spirochaetales bacterium]